MILLTWRAFTHVHQLNEFTCKLFFAQNESARQCLKCMVNGMVIHIGRPLHMEFSNVRAWLDMCTSHCGIRRRTNWFFHECHLHAMDLYDMLLIAWTNEAGLSHRIAHHTHTVCAYLNVDGKKNRILMKHLIQSLVEP